MVLEPLQPYDDEGEEWKNIAGRNRVRRMKQVWDSLPAGRLTYINAGLGARDLTHGGRGGRGSGEGIEGGESSPGQASDPGHWAWSMGEPKAKGGCRAMARTSADTGEGNKVGSSYAISPSERDARGSRGFKYRQGSVFFFSPSLEEDFAQGRA